MDIPCIQTRSITLEWWPLYICGMAFYNLQLHHFHLTFASVQADLLTGHIIGSFPQDYPLSMHVMASAWSWSSYHCRDKAWNVMEYKTMGIPRGDKVPLGDNRSATCGKLYLRHDSVLFIVSSLCDLYTCIPRGYRLCHGYTMGWYVSNHNCTMRYCTHTGWGYGPNLSWHGIMWNPLNLWYPWFIVYCRQPKQNTTQVHATCILLHNICVWWFPPSLSASSHSCQNIIEDNEVIAVPRSQTEMHWWMKPRASCEWIKGDDDLVRRHIWQPLM